MEGKVDFLGNTLALGDEVVFMQIGYRGLMKGTLVKMGELKGTISHEETNICSIESKQYYQQMIKIIKHN